MEDKEIFNKLEKIFRECLDISFRTEITLDTKFREDLGVDSLDLYELIFVTEGELNIRLPDEELAKLNTFKDALEYLKTNYKL